MLINAGVIMEKQVKEAKIKYTRRGGIYVKPSDIVKTEKGRELIVENYNSKLAKSIREQRSKVDNQ